MKVWLHSPLSLTTSSPDSMIPPLRQCLVNYLFLKWEGVCEISSKPVGSGCGTRKYKISFSLPHLSCTVWCCATERREGGAAEKSCTCLRCFKQVTEEVVAFSGSSAAANESLEKATAAMAAVATGWLHWQEATGGIWSRKRRRIQKNVQNYDYSTEMPT